ncbi:hypothetical protein ANCDUO_08744, partial [Ancylostoma duodenale]
TYSSGNVRFNSSTHGMDPDRKEMRAFLVVGGPSVIPGKREWITFFVLIIPSICIVILFMIYACKHTILSENQSWAWSQKGYRPLVMNTVDMERVIAPAERPPKNLFNRLTGGGPNSKMVTTTGRAAHGFRPIRVTGWAARQIRLSGASKTG